MTKNKIAISIGTTAYNEEKSIKQMLESVCRQKGTSFIIKEILVISDGSTDKTIMMAESVKNEKIKIFNHSERKGKSSRVDELLQKFSGEYLVLLDSDLVMKDNNVIEKLISRCSSDKKIGLVAAHLHPLLPKTFIEAAINNYRYAREYLENEYSFNNSVYGAHGCLVYSREFAKHLTIPTDILSDDTYSFFRCIANGYKFSHVKDAIIFYRSPQTIKDHINQAKRHFAGGTQLEKYFDKNLMSQKFNIPKLILIKLMLFQLLKNPFGYIFLKLLNAYCADKGNQVLNKLNIFWEPIGSTKIGPSRI